MIRIRTRPLKTRNEPTPLHSDCSTLWHQKCKVHSRLKISASILNVIARFCFLFVCFFVWEGDRVRVGVTARVRDRGRG
jgi:hypothetical protein